MKPKKDFAVLLYTEKYLVSTAEMDADELGWYTRLLLHNYDKGDLPKEIDDLSGLCNVKPSQYKRFELVISKLIKERFVENANGRLENPKTSEVMQSRKLWKEKRTLSGKWGYWINYLRKNFQISDEQIYEVKGEIKDADFVEMDKDAIIPLLDFKCKEKGILYININRNIDNNNSTKEKNDFSKKNTEVHIIPTMWLTFKSSQPKYPGSMKLDFPHLLGIAEFIHEQQKLPGNLRSPESLNGQFENVKNAINATWSDMCQVIKEDKFFKKLQLSTILKQIQAIYQQYEDGKETGVRDAPDSPGHETEFDKA